MSDQVRPWFISYGQVLEIHELHRISTGGLIGVRDPNLLDSALAQPEASFGGMFLHDTLYAMASAYLFHVVKNHPFVDGNKRVGLATALSFLEVNGWIIDQPTSMLEEMTLAVADSRLTKQEVAEVFRRLAQPLDPSTPQV